MNKKISNWGNFPIVKADVFEPLFETDVKDYVAAHESHIARGSGRCYGDAALSTHILSTVKLNAILHFDEAGIIECQSGILLSEIIEFILPRGFFLPVTPGTKHITLGGAVASDVHGKNHHVEGCFSSHVISFRMVNAEGDIITCSETENESLFWDTFGAMGRTGVLLSVRFSLKPVETAYIKQETIKVRNLEDMFRAFEEAGTSTYAVAWMDCLKRGSGLGRGLLMKGEHAAASDLDAKQAARKLNWDGKSRMNVPFNFPGFVLNHFVVRIVNFLIYHKQFARQKSTIVSLDKFFYPLDSFQNWNRMYGKRGFIQYQFVCPKSHGRDCVQEIIALTGHQRNSSFLVVLKLLGKKSNLAVWSFPEEGYTLTLDIKVSRSISQFVRAADEIVKKYGGRVYLAKDAMSSREVVDIFPKRSRFSSLQSRRLLNY